MDLSLPPSTNSTRPRTPTVTNCEHLVSIKNDIHKFGTVIESIKACINSLQFAGVADDNDLTLLDHNKRLAEYQKLQQMANQEPLKTTATKRKENEDGFTSPTSRQISKNRRTISQAELNFKIDLQNKFDNLRIDQIAGSSSTNTAQAQDNNIRPSKTTNRKTLNQNTKNNTIGNNNYLPPPVFLKITDDYRIQMKALNDRLPALRSKMTGEYCKLYTDTDDQHHELNQVLEEFNVNVEGYDGKGVTQCYSCNKFNHIADNCLLAPRCPKCGEKHQTRDCQIKHVEQAYCINCQVFGHMANYAKCPLYPKPRKGSVTKNKNDYISIVNGIVRPNVSYVQATNNTNNNSTSNKQMASQVKENPAINTQTQAPVALPPNNLSKIAEHIILNRINKFINDTNFLNPNQYGFTRQLSTYHPLVRLTEKISAGFQRGRSTGAVFLDIQKAFDRVWISGLIYKLIINHFPVPLIPIINSYLVNRTFKVRVNNTLSLPHNVTIGVTQGSLLGPVLLNVYLNDIPSHPQTMLNLYADDTNSRHFQKS
ncbi:probable RNA-directed DNA polymerase from transposon BS [Trichonephila clavipes]|nr:probable RNA-directed DNA polymerase from transposon BS [Trichonephila clavipes]